jgi:signal transduction histidine kinase/CheY-like chemotaxis protein
MPALHPLIHLLARALPLAALIVIGSPAPARAVPAAAAPGAAAITSIIQYQELPTEAKQRPATFRFECDVTYYDSELNLLWVQDGESAAQIVPGPRPLPIQPGQRILVTGTHPPGSDLSFANASFQVVALASPAPLATENRLEQTSLLNNRLVTVEAIVDRLAPPSNGRQQYLLSVEGRPASAWLRLAPGQKAPDLTNTRVRFTGVYNSSREPNGGPASLSLMVSSAERLLVLSPLKTDPRFELPRTPIDRLNDCPPNTLVHLMGVSSGGTPGHSIQLRDSSGQIELLTAQTLAGAVGTPVEAIGYPRVSGSSWQLANAVYRPIARPDNQLVAPTSIPPLLLAAQVSALPASDATAAHPVRLTGVVTWSHPESPLLYIQDSTGGLCVRRPPNEAIPSQPGQRIEIHGSTAMGQFAPTVEASGIVGLGAAPLPSPKAVSLDHALTGAEEAERLELSGYVRAIRREGQWATLELATAAGDFTAKVATSEDLTRVADSVVRLTGVCSASANEQRQLQSVTLWLADPAAIEITEAAPADNFDRPLRDIASLGRYGSIQTYEHRIKVRGTVTHHTPGVSIQIIEAGAPLLVLSRDPAPLKQGDQIEAVGFLGRHGRRLALREAYVRKSGTAPLPSPLTMVSADQLRPAFVGRLVQLDGHLIATAAAGRKLRLTIQSESGLFEAYLRTAAPNNSAAPPWPTGSTLSLTGVYDLQYDAYGQPNLVQLHLQDAANVTLLQRPPWLDRGRILTLASVLALGILLVSLWGATLRQRVRRQTDQIRRQLERESLMEAELQRTSKLESLGLLAGGIAHDFNNLLTVVKGNLSLVGLDPGLQPDSAACLRDADKAISRSRDLTMQLLTFAKGGDPVRTAVALADIVQETTRFALHGSPVRAEFALAPDLWPAQVDKGQIGQVVQNIVINAAQALPQGGRIHIALTNETVPAGDLLLAAGRYLRLTLSDNGPGIAPEALPHIFDPYFTTKKTGHGIGLATVHSIVKKHQGHITVASTLGQGTIFKIWLPAAAAVAAVAAPSTAQLPTAGPAAARPPATTPAPAAAPAATAVPVAAAAPVASAALPPSSAAAPAAVPAPAIRQRGRALVLDDEECIRRMSSAMLQRLGLEPVAVADGHDALRAYTQARQEGRPFALVILDLTIPGGLGGEETMRELLKTDPEVRAIVSSGYSNNPVLSDHRRYGFKGKVSKPYQFADLGLVVDQLLPKSN